MVLQVKRKWRDVFNGTEQGIRFNEKEEIKLRKGVSRLMKILLVQESDWLKRNPHQQHHQEASTFLNNGCTDTSFLETFDVSVVYSNKCNNENLTMIYQNVYIFP